MAGNGEFRAIVLDEAEGKVRSSLQTLDEGRLPDGDVLVRIASSDLNYKDGMVLKGIGKLVKSYPHVPGIDFSGVVEKSPVAAVQGRRRGHPHRLAGGRGALGRLCQQGPPRRTRSLREVFAAAHDRAADGDPLQDDVEDRRGEIAGRQADEARPSLAPHQLERLR